MTKFRLTVSLIAMLWALWWGFTVDSWWRLLIVSALCLAWHQSEKKETYAEILAALIAAGVLFKVYLVGIDQRAGIFNSPTSDYWEIWMMATWLLLALMCLRISIEGTISLAVVGVAFAFAKLYDVLMFHVIAEIAVMFALLSVWRRFDGNLIGLPKGAWRMAFVGGTIGWLVGNHNNSIDNSSVDAKKERQIDGYSLVIVKHRTCNCCRCNNGFNRNTMEFHNT